MLSALYPGRIDLGLGRSGGSEPTTDLRIRRTVLDYDSFDDDVRETVHHLDVLGADGVEVFVLGRLARDRGPRRAGGTRSGRGRARGARGHGPDRRGLPGALPSAAGQGPSGGAVRPGPSLRRALPADRRRGLRRRGAAVAPLRPAALPGPAAHRWSTDAAARRRRSRLVGERAVPGGRHARGRAGRLGRHRARAAARRRAAPGARRGDGDDRPAGPRGDDGLVHAGWPRSRQSVARERRCGRRGPTDDRRTGGRRPARRHARDRYAGAGVPLRHRRPRGVPARRAAVADGGRGRSGERRPARGGPQHAGRGRTWTATAAPR